MITESVRRERGKSESLDANEDVVATQTLGRQIFYSFSAR